MFIHIRKTNDRSEKVNQISIYLFCFNFKFPLFFNSQFKKIINHEDPNELKKCLDLAIPKDPLSLDVIINDCQQTIDHAVKTGIACRL